MMPDNIFGLFQRKWGYSNVDVYVDELFRNPKIEGQEDPGEPPPEFGTDIDNTIPFDCDFNLVAQLTQC